MSKDDHPLVSTKWLDAHLNDANLRIIDVRWGPKIENGQGSGVDDYEGYLAGHIPGAVFLAIGTELSDPDHPIPDMLVGPEHFAELMGKLGIDDQATVIVYDNMGVPVGSARLWWALSYYGHDNVKVLDGGLKQWQAEGREISTDVPSVDERQFNPKRRADWIADKEDVVAALDDPTTLIIDCLSKDQYSGSDGNNPWGTRAGHIPGAVNVPAISNLDPRLGSASLAERARLLGQMSDFRFRGPDVLQDLYGAAGLTPDQTVITYCGRGYAASCGLLALKSMGHGNARMYDGSWAEWSADPTLPSETGDGVKKA